MSALVVPSVHMNGTSRESLIEERCAAYRKLGEALDALAEMSPNARDYYVQAAGAFELAREQHARRVKALRDVRDELTAEVEALDA